MHALAALAAASAVALTASPGPDFGTFRDQALQARAPELFGVTGPIPASSTLSLAPQVAEADPRALVTLARSLQARVVSAAPGLGANIDMMALWPSDERPTHLIACNEQGAAQPGLQRIRLSDGAVETILAGTISCDPVRRTPWGTIIAGEESGADGSLIEVLDPLAVTGATYDHAARTVSGPGAGLVAARPAVGRLSWEGIGLLPNGVMYYGDENRPSRGTAGGAYFKFVPAVPWTGGPAIRSLDRSPLAAGAVYGLRLGRRSGGTDHGQGTNTGLGSWIPVAAADVGNLRAAAAALKLTGYYRPEDIDLDGAALAAGRVRFCANNTGNEADDWSWGETLCVSDGTLGEAAAGTAVPEVQLLVPGNPELAMMDNLAWQPGRGSWIIHEDGDGPEAGRNNDLWACLEDGTDPDDQSDGCIRIATLNDLNAEWTGGFFDASGTHFYVSVQHNVTGHGVILDVTGWR
ncbi:hypothetical protein [Anaeromyxobacter sp. PSR-1]|uniref:hypothetical protein n=1 Tax=Anaeromyxobacter sp. PSR-1 TaxID=1300915 RepID=UPI0005E11B96|nr:hypothetical protein [Anaeromyxobacter sp. PSR-1]GAO03808.1 hypothetical protein PSR1_02694 [Anaeromyxobacter sp. PSR-1]